MTHQRGFMSGLFIVYLSGDVLSLCEHFFNKFKGTTGKDVYALFEQFTTAGVETNKIGLLIMQKANCFLN